MLYSSKAQIGLHQLKDRRRRRRPITPTLIYLFTWWVEAGALLVRRQHITKTTK